VNRRGLSGIALAIGAVVVLALVAMVAFAAGATWSDRGGIGWMDGIMGRRFGGIGGFGGFGGIGMVFGWLLMLLVIGGIVWALVVLLRPAEPRPPEPWTPPAGPPAGPPTAPSPAAAPDAEAFEAWHRQAHAADAAGSSNRGAADDAPAAEAASGDAKDS
jgi:predicted lipid-binding transport protein (Tim44 family)